jgi:hypothetical protein
MLLVRLMVCALGLVFVSFMVGCEGGDSCRKSLEEDGGTTGPGGGGDSGGDTGGGSGGGGGNPGNADPLDLTWAVNDNASQSDLQWMAERIKQIANYLWQATEGQAYLRDQALKNNSSSGDVIVMRVKGSMGNPPAYCTSGSGFWRITISTGEIPAQGWLHELGHGYIGPFAGEEYDCINQSAGVCIQAAMVAGTGEGFLKWCDESNCVSHQKCWTKIKQSHGWQHPGPGGTAPTCNVTIQ